MEPLAIIILIICIETEFCSWMERKKAKKRRQEELLWITRNWAKYD